MTIAHFNFWNNVEKSHVEFFQTVQSIYGYIYNKTVIAKNAAPLIQ